MGAELDIATMQTLLLRCKAASSARDESGVLSYSALLLRLAPMAHEARYFHALACKNKGSLGAAVFDARMVSWMIRP